MRQKAANNSPAANPGNIQQRNGMPLGISNQPPREIKTINQPKFILPKRQSILKD